MYLGKTSQGALRALKVLQEKKITKGEIAAASVLDKFLFMPRLSLSLLCHRVSTPYITRVYQICPKNDRIIFEMEYADSKVIFYSLLLRISLSQSLEHLLTNKRRLSEPQTRFYLYQICL